MAKNNKNNNELRKFLIEQINNNGIQLRDYHNLKDKNRTLERFNKNPYKETKRAFELENKREERIKDKNSITVDGVVIKESEAIDKASKKLKDDEQIVLRKIDLSPIEDEEELKSLSDDEKIVLRKIDLTPILEKEKSNKKDKTNKKEKENQEDIIDTTIHWKQWIEEELEKIKAEEGFDEEQYNEIQEAQKSLEKRKKKMKDFDEMLEDIKKKQDARDREYKIKLSTDKEYEQAFYIGEVVEQALYDMCAVARTYSWTVPDRIFFVEETVKDSKIKYGEKTFYNNLWNKQGETLENCQTIVMSSKGQDVSRQVQRVKTLLLEIPYDEIEIDD